jgi:hypothetical protein
MNVCLSRQKERARKDELVDENYQNKLLKIHDTYCAGELYSYVKLPIILDESIMDLDFRIEGENHEQVMMSVDEKLSQEVRLNKNL